MSLVTGDALSLLLFRLHSGRLLGINLLKVNEIIPCPALTKLPNRHPNVRGIATLRGAAMTVIDLARAIGERGAADEDDGCLIVTELSRSRQGLHVKSVERIVQCSTRDVRPPPAGSGARAFITGVTQIDGAIVQVLDIEKVLHDIAPALEEAPVGQLLDGQDARLLQGRRVLLVDDSQVALQQTLNVLRQLGLDCTAVRSAQAALQQLHEYHQAGMPFELLVSDIEMPELDGYSLVQEIRRSPDIADTYVLLHTSLDSTMNTEKARSVGANAVLTKFSSVDLSQALLDAFRQMSGQH
ncbi:chemotaxis protein [Pseudomonas chengduensis]|jgi:two-component system chemotaxis response regulator CheV|uniref:Two-component system, chemotaxis family, response regulator CheV n=1 Tax=Pseudomonas sihuiensis TaxID=1274359 RepID=A0A1H2LDS6_9PSED|nr:MULTISPECIES: chemotaxis protein [Pseudomonas]KJU78632.1 chemotaxis protein CheW [Pseudomonas oleovorans]APU30466.1 chemotaxis protein CheW [Pseudomonas alcaliphila JAB1]KJU78638.1 chemotaxis protein CheW [Pseudomonas oleovorans]MBG0847428.1 chemotaxis protein CheV [Pseudomonas chengduensis]MDH1212291.1 chemotaxis protein [Pseudomonas chengduensis]